jgi:hypothetical protein
VSLAGGRRQILIPLTQIEKDFHIISHKVNIIILYLGQCLGNRQDAFDLPLHRYRLLFQNRPVQMIQALNLSR